MDERCVGIDPAAAAPSRQGHEMFMGVCAENAGSRALCMHLVRIPPGGRAKAHLHADHESAVYVVSGRATTWFGPRLEHRVDTGPGGFLYIPAGVPHLPVNLSATEPVIGLIARTDPSEQESVVLLPDLDDLPHVRAPLGREEPTS